MRRLVALIAICGAFVTSATGKTFIYHNGAPMQLHVTGVRSIAPERRLGFSKSLEVFAVDAYSTVSVGSWVSPPQRKYVLYCVKIAPEAGSVYDSQDEYIDANYSFLHLWPVDKESLGLKERGRLYRVVSINNVSAGPHPDLACDVYSAKDLK
jgi:hypothetical protein